MSILRKISNQDGEHCGYTFWCPGCEERHFVPTENYHITWNFNGDEEHPTFTPSVKITHSSYDKDCCHFFITNGHIHYCGDCTHQLSGKTIKIEDKPELED